MRADHRSRFRRPTSRRCLGPRPNPGAPSGAASLDTTPPSSPCRATDVRGDPPWLPLELLTAIDGAFHVFIARGIHPEEATDVDEPPRAWTKPEIATGIRALNMCKSGLTRQASGAGLAIGRQSRGSASQPPWYSARSTDLECSRKSGGVVYAASSWMCLNPSSYSCGVK